ncbi:MAG: DNA/RNA nuclease SfsA, partial [Longimicrobiales bacterium]|nr:DNA/RNA nuclease SfsA [Longimicrobiales bacterium]
YPARFLHRPNRFVVHAGLVDPEGRDRSDVPGLPDGFSPDQEVVCHMADPGRLRELLVPERPLLLRYAPAPHRKTSWSLVLVEAPAGNGWVSVDTALPNRLIHEALQQGALDELQGWTLERREFSHGSSRLDFLLTDGGERNLALEVKSVTLVEGREALFPDAVTARGARHMEELTELTLRPDWEAAVLFVLQRDDAQSIRAARSIDPTFAEALEEARNAGVRILGRRCHVSPRRVILGESVPAH